MPEPDHQQNRPIGFSPDSPLARHTPDPGSASVRKIALIVLLVSVIAVAAMQQLTLAAAPSILAEEVVPGEVLPPTSGDPMLMMSKLGLKLGTLILDEAPDQADAAAPLITQIETVVVTPPEALRAAVVAYELGNQDSAEALVERMSTRLTADGFDWDPVLLDDAAYIQSVYVTDSAIAIPDGFSDRHGWFAEVVATAGSASAGGNTSNAPDPRRGGGVLVGILVVAGVGAVLVALSSLVMLIIAIFLLATSSEITKRWFVPPAVGGSVYLEVAAIFATGFLVVQLLGGLVAQFASEQVAAYVTLSVQWLLLGVVAWPMFRGVSFRRWRADLGMVAPHGLFREIFSGLMLYLAWLPIYLIIAICSALLLVTWNSLMGSPDAAPPSNPVIDMVSGADPIALALFASLAVVWAPLAEEMVFRGCLYRHARSRVGFVVAAMASAAAFGVMHGYHFFMLTPVIALGVMFAFMREWRGSLVGPIFAHMLHNGTLVALMIALFSIIG